MSCQDCLNRRDFLAKSAMAAAALVAVEGCGDGQIGPTAATLGGGVTITLAEFPDLATVGKLVSIRDNRAVVRTSATTFQAFSRVCTHEGCATEVKNNRFECPCHGSIFAVDGSVVRGPSTGVSITPLPTRAVQFDSAAGKLTIA